MIEVLVVVVIITTVLVGVAGMYVQSTRAGIQATEYTIATSLAQDRMEKVKADQSVLNPEPQTINGVEYNITSQETPSSIDSSNLFQLQVTVEWVDRGQNQTLILTSYLVRNIL